MVETRVLIAAAGNGSRAGLPYPKTLHPIDGRPILSRLLDVLSPYDAEPVIVVSPIGRQPIAEMLARAGWHAELIVQDRATGMGDAILHARQSRRPEVEHILLAWGDLPMLQPQTIAAVHAAHIAHANDMTFATRTVDSAYTMVQRGANGTVEGVVETREAGILPGPGERDIGLFALRIAVVLDLLAQRLPGGIGATTGEHGFLYIVAHLAARGYKVEALPVATELDLISLNRLTDLDVLASGDSGPTQAKR